MALLLATAAGTAYAQLGASATSLVVVKPSDEEIPVDYGSTYIVPMFFEDQTRFWLRRSVEPAPLLLPVVPALMVLADPPRQYPKAWKDGGGAFGRNFGDALTEEEAARTGRYLAGALLQEDPRYYPSASTHIAGRAAYAVIFTFVDRSTHGKPRPAFSNFIGAAAGGFVGNTYLPRGYDDPTHALQRTGGNFVGYGETQLVGFVAENLILEFHPELREFGRWLHLPFVR